MKTQQQWFNKYVISHKNETNKAIHLFCVPAIYFSIVGLLIRIPSTSILSIVKINNPILGNCAVVILIPLLFVYIKLSRKTAIKMLLFSMFFVLTNYYISLILPLFFVSLLFL